MVIAEMEKEEVITGLKRIYGEDDCNLCVGHRNEERKEGTPECGLMIHAAAVVMKIDILMFWKPIEEEKWEWMLALASMKSNKYTDHQLLLKYDDNGVHVDLAIEVA